MTLSRVAVLQDTHFELNPTTIGIENIKFKERKLKKIPSGTILIIKSHEDLENNYTKIVLHGMDLEGCTTWHVLSKDVVIFDLSIDVSFRKILEILDFIDKIHIPTGGGPNGPKSK